jgi:hypothetical protein
VKVLEYTSEGDMVKRIQVIDGIPAEPVFVLAPSKTAFAEWCLSNGLRPWSRKMFYLSVRDARRALRGVVTVNLVDLIGASNWPAEMAAYVRMIESAGVVVQRGECGS